MRVIQLTRGMVTLVDDEDYERLSAHSWSAVEGRNGSFYAGRVAFLANGRQRGRQMQRDVLDPEMMVPGTLKADHRNGDTLDNRKQNLRWASDSLSNINRCTPKSNTSGYRGVWFCKKSRVWRTAIRLNKRTVQGGRHATPEAAALAYNALAREHHGADAHLNVVPGAPNV